MIFRTQTLALLIILGLAAGTENAIADKPLVESYRNLREKIKVQIGPSAAKVGKDRALDRLVKDTWSDVSVSQEHCSIRNPAGCECPDGSEECDLLPDMTASALTIQNQHYEYPGYLRLSNTTPNIGWGPLEVHGTGSCFCDTDSVPCSTPACPDGSIPKELITQRIYHKSGRIMTYYDRPAGTMSYHPSHRHVHVNNWGAFTLRKDNGDPNPLNWPIVGPGTKMSFCLINTGDCTSDYGSCVDPEGNIITMDDIPNAPFGVVSGCGKDQSIYTGMLDFYNSSLPGMRIDFPNICNGDYHIVSITDPDNYFLESNEDNNWVAVPATLTRQLDCARE